MRTSAPVFSQRAAIELMEETRWARKALAVIFESSADHRPEIVTFAAGTQFW